MKVLTESKYQADEIPRNENFPKAIEDFEKGCLLNRHGKIHEGVYGFLRYGSTARGEFNPASDVDYFVVLRDPKHIWEVRKASQDIEQGFHIQIDKRCLTLENAQKANHAVQLNFRNHLLLARELYGFAGEDPVEVLELQSRKLRPAIRQTLGHYLDTLSKRYTDDVDETAHAKLLETVLNKPIYCMREMIQFSLKGPIKSDGELVDDFESVRDLFFDCYNNRNLLREIMDIKMLRDKYVHLLEERIGQEMNDDLIRKWEEISQSIFFAHGKAMEIVRGCLELTR